ncbi:MAG: HAD family hydrolase, partial [Planctomycetes bacterium]|nr:HAD family hydrolase [Planctomycetota bacterium]
FDFGGTLDNDGADWFTRLHQAITQRTGPMDREDFNRIAMTAANAISDIDDTPKLSMAGTAQRLCQTLHSHMSRESVRAPGWQADDVAEEFMSHAQEFLQRNLNVLEQLKKRYRLGVISNNWGNTAGWCSHYKFDHLMDTIIDSAVVGAVKPERKIFDAALDQLQLPAQQCAYVGDRYDCDMIGAHDAGMFSIWITPPGTEPGPRESIPTRRIHKLTELLELT